MSPGARLHDKTQASPPLAQGLYLLSWLNLLATAVLLAAWASFGADWPLALFELLGGGS